MLSFLLLSALLAAGAEANLQRHGISRMPHHSSINKRGHDNARLTYYSPGEGACGGYNSESDWIVALDVKAYAGGAHCYEKITIWANGKSAEAQVVDECPGCPDDALDLSQSLFNYFDSLDKGVLYGSWDFTGRKRAEDDDEDA